MVVGKNDEVHHEPAVDSSEEFERETDALLSRGAALMEEPAGGAEKGADTAVHESKPTSPASPERRATPPPAITSDTSPSAASSEDENREPGVDDEIAAGQANPEPGDTGDTDRDTNRHGARCTGREPGGTATCIHAAAEAGLDR